MKEYYEKLKEIDPYWNEPKCGKWFKNKFGEEL